MKMKGPTLRCRMVKDNGISKKDLQFLQKLVEFKAKVKELRKNG